MSSLINLEKRSVSFIAIGGAGTEAQRGYRDNHPRHHSQLANEVFTYIDTSPSNLAGVDGKTAYLIPGFDGAGGDRAKVAAAFQEHLPQIAMKHPFEKVVVLTFAASGGSGAAGGPIVTRYLLEKGHRVFLNLIVSHDSFKRTNNSFLTISGLQALPAELKRSLVVTITENDPTKPHSDNNVVPQFVLGALSMLNSGLNHGMDTADLDSFCDFHNVTHHQPSMVLLDVVVDVKKIADLPKPLIAIASLLAHRDQRAPQIDTDYDTFGYLPPIEDNAHLGDDAEKSYGSFYFLISTAGLAPHFKRLTEQRNRAQMQKQVVATPVLLDAGQTTAGAGGLLYD